MAFPRSANLPFLAAYIERKIVRPLVSTRNTFRIVPTNYAGMYYTWQCDLNSSKGFAAEKSDKSFLSVLRLTISSPAISTISSFLPSPPLTIHSSFPSFNPSFQPRSPRHCESLFAPAKVNGRATLSVIFNDPLFFPRSLSLSLRVRPLGRARIVGILNTNLFQAQSLIESFDGARFQRRFTAAWKNLISLKILFATDRECYAANTFKNNQHMHVYNL